MRYTGQMRIPPFERFYESHRDEIWAFLVRKLGRERAEDAFQETFLRALRAYPSLEHGRHLRAWAYTIAGRIAIDVSRERRPAATAATSNTVLLASEESNTVLLASEDGRPAYAQIEHLAAGLPPTERAAVVLRYGYDLDYEDIGEALGSSAEAARQAASSGVRRLRRKELA